MNSNNRFRGGGGHKYRQGNEDEDIGIYKESGKNWHNDYYVNDTLMLHFKMMDEKTQDHADIREAYKDTELKVSPNLGVPKLTTFEMPITDGTTTTYLDPKIVERLRYLRYTKLTLSQELSIPYAALGHNVVLNAQTGSGKTLGFLIPILQDYYKTFYDPTALVDSNSQGYSTPKCLVLTPTRELTVQIERELIKMIFDHNVRYCSLFGGMHLERQMKTLSTKKVDFIIACPGRLLDLLKRGKLNLSKVKYLVLDEADRMMEMGFELQLKEIFDDYGLTLHKCLIMMASATFPPKVMAIARRYIREHVFIQLPKEENATNKNIEQVIKIVEEQDKLRTVFTILSTYDLANNKALIFCNRKATCDLLQAFLSNNRIPTGVLHSDKAQVARVGIINDFIKGTSRVMIATDVAARGLDLPNVHLVVNHDMPENIDDYYHRIGRTGRAGQSGTAITFVNHTTNYSVLRELKGILDEYTQDINEEFLGLMHELEGVDQPRKKQIRYLDDDHLSNWRSIARNEHDKRDRYVNGGGHGGYGNDQSSYGGQGKGNYNQGGDYNKGTGSYGHSGGSYGNQGQGGNSYSNNESYGGNSGYGSGGYSQPRGDRGGFNQREGGYGGGSQGFSGGNTQPQGGYSRGGRGGYGGGSDHHRGGYNNGGGYNQGNSNYTQGQGGGYGGSYMNKNNYNDNTKYSDNRW